MIVLKMVKNLKKVEYYKERYISEAIKTGEKSTIEGKIEEYKTLTDGFSGIIFNSVCEVPFYISNKYICTEEEKGMVSILFYHSIKSKKEMKMKGHFDKEKGMFKVESLEYTYNNFNYVI